MFPEILLNQLQILFVFCLFRVFLKIQFLNQKVDQNLQIYCFQNITR